MVYVTKSRGERVVETVDSPPEKFTLPFPSAQDLATQAAAELTHALLHPQPAGPFFKVGDEQTIALKRLADIFEGATQQKSKVVIPPTDGVGNAAPQRVQNIVSPLWVANTTTAQQIPPHPTTSSHSTPNYHRRQQTPPRCAVAPPPPHVMVRRSARQQHNFVPRHDSRNN
jgi:hypothetical protein